MEQQQFNENPKFTNQPTVPPQSRQQNYPKPKETKNKFLTFCFSLLPGACQMYHGFFKKGLSLMVIFYGIIAVAVTLYLSPICFVLPIVWFYSFFDGINHMNTSVDELKSIEDKFLLDINFNKNGMFTGFFKKKNLFLGWVFIAVGAYALLNALLMGNYSFIHNNFQPYVYDIILAIRDFIPRLVVPVVCIIIGMKLINFKKIKEDFK